METQTNFETVEIGTKESTKLEPANVKIVKVSIEPVGSKDAKKVQCEVKHPSSETLIKVSSAKIERKGKLEVGGLWFNLDDDNKIKKGSLLASFLNFMQVKNVKELEGKQCQTVEDDSGYLVFKAY